MMVARTVVFRGWFLARSYLTAIRLNGKEVPVPRQNDDDGRGSSSARSCCETASLPARTRWSSTSATWGRATLKTVPWPSVCK